MVMKNENTIELTEEYKWPEYSEWQCQLFGSGINGIVFRPHKGHHPNWFWRKMQYLCFGNKWEKKEK